MNEIGSTILEILKYTLPSLVVFLTIYFTLKKYLEQQYNLEALRYKKEENKQILPLKLQAYERLALFCERISPEQLVYRLNGPQMQAGALRTAAIISVQKEFEHNLTQQIYISDNLWKIISLAKDQVLNQIASVPVEDASSSQDYINALLASINNGNKNPIFQAQSAIKKETQLILR